MRVNKSFTYIFGEQCGTMESSELRLQMMIKWGKMHYRKLKCLPRVLAMMSSLAFIMIFCTVHQKRYAWAFLHLHTGKGSEVLLEYERKCCQK